MDALHKARIKILEIVLLNSKSKVLICNMPLTIDNNFCFGSVVNPGIKLCSAGVPALVL